MSALSFREHMSGWISFDELSYNQALLDGRRRGTRCAYDLEIDIDDIDRFYSDPRHAATARGRVVCDELGGELKVERGWFNLFVDAGGPRHRRMLYRLFLRDPLGKPLTLSGFKDLEAGPRLEAWSDTSHLLVRVLAGHLEEEPEGSESTIATGILHITVAGLARMLSSMRPSGGSWRDRARALARFDELFTRELAEVYYEGRPLTEDSDPWPQPTALATRWQGQQPGEWHDLPGHPGLRRRIVEFRAGDGFLGTLHHIRGEREPDRGPVLLAHGSSVRANMFYDAPTSTTLVDLLVDRGYDVWLENWRASIDLTPSDWTLDQAAVYDHPAAVAKVLEETGHRKLKAVVHCQGSTSFTMALVAGLLPEVTTVVSNAVSLHVKLTTPSLVKLSVLPPAAAPLLHGLDPQWAIRPPTPLTHAFALWTSIVRHGCDDPVCKFANYAYGVGPDVLWRHANLTPDVHNWISRDWGFCPLTFFRQMARCARAGHLVPVAGLSALPLSLVAKPPQTDARITFLAGDRNHCFLPASQQRSFEWFERYRPGRHALHLLPGYTHLDVFFGRNAPVETFPVILGALER